MSQSQQGKTAEQAVQTDPPGRDQERARIEELAREHYDDLVLFLRRRFPVQEALEAAQEAFVRLLSHDSSEIRSLRGFVYKTAENAAIDSRRREWALFRARISMLSVREGSDGRTPERRLSGEQALQELLRVIESMPAKCRLAFVLHQIEGRDYSQIAEQMGLTESSVRKYVTRGLLDCQRRIDLEPRK